MGTESQPMTGILAIHLQKSEAKTLAAMAAAAFENVATANSGHSFSEAVSFGTFSFVRIIGKAHGLSPEIKI